MQNIENQLLLWLPKLGMAIAVFFCFWVISKTTQTMLRKLGDRWGLKEPIRSLVSGVAKISILAFGTVTALGTLGINVSALVAGLGLSGYALGFALKDTISNLLAGVLILVYYPFDIGNYIVVSGEEGKVTHIDFRYTTLENNDKIILIPNSLVFAKTVSILKKNE